MATNNNLRDWANAFNLALVQWANDIAFEKRQQELRGRTTRELKPPVGYGAGRKQVYILRTLLPGVLAITGLKPAEIETIVVAFDKIRITGNNPINSQSQALAAYRQWFNRYILPLTK